MVKLALIVGSTRPNRFADRPAAWVADAAKDRTDFALDVLDLRDFALPFFGEGGGGDPSAVDAWKARVAEFDGYLVTAAEYNHGPTGVLKNALDSAGKEWYRKPIAFIGYGGVGGARAVEQLRLVAVELQMAPIKHAVHIGGEAYWGAAREGRSLGSYDHLNDSLVAVFDQMVWWARALKAARES